MNDNEIVVVLSRTEDTYRTLLDTLVLKYNDYKDMVTDKDSHPEDVEHALIEAEKLRGVIESIIYQTESNFKYPEIEW